jgi:hypothetical protein
MSLSVGTLYTGRELLEVFSKYQISETLQELPKRSYVASYADSVNIALACGWIRVEGIPPLLKLSPRGKDILSQPDIQECLRLQIEDFIETMQPPWCRLIPHGRRSATLNMPSDARQCFREAGLLETNLTDRIVDWWDRLASKSRGRHKDVLNEIGRCGERLSITYETARVGIPPKWQAIECNGDGYDLLSYVSNLDLSRQTIEVKASEKNITYASLHVSRNEWEFGKTAGVHRFHLWANVRLKSPLLAVLSVEDLSPHIPTNNGEGSWESVEIPFAPFSAAFSEYQPPEGGLP